MVFDTGSAAVQDEAMDRERSIAETIRAANVQAAFFHSGLPRLMSIGYLRRFAGWDMGVIQLYAITQIGTLIASQVAARGTRRE